MTYIVHISIVVYITLRVEVLFFDGTKSYHSLKKSPFFSLLVKSLGNLPSFRSLFQLSLKDPKHLGLLSIKGIGVCTEVLSSLTFNYGLGKHNKRYSLFRRRLQLVKHLRRTFSS